MPAPIVVSVRTDFVRLERSLTDLQQKQLPFAASQAANKLAKLGLADLVTKMEEVFDRPTGFTKRGFYARLGTKRDPHGEILGRAYAAKGTPAEKYLAPEILGGQRNMKRFERALGYRIGEATFVVPGKGAKLDQYGNVPVSQINKILSAIGAAETHAGYKANRTTKSAGRRGNDVFFVATSKRDGRPLAVYRVVSSGKVEPVLVFTRRTPTYRPRLRFYAVIKESVERHRTKVFDEALAQAVATARPDHI